MKTKTYDLVKELLTDDSRCRDSDKRLRLAVWFELGLVSEHGSKYCITVENYMKAPNDETIRRCRQAIQAKFPELRGSEKVRKMRKEIEDQRGTWIYREEIKEQAKLI